jgi:hypothetical protein
VARMEKLRKDNVRAIKNALASRGALRSGEAGYQLGEEQQRYSTAQYDARSQLVDLLAGIEAGYANSSRARAGQQAGAANTAFGNAVQSGYQPPQQAAAPQPQFVQLQQYLSQPGVEQGLIDQIKQANAGKTPYKPI